VFPGLKGGWGGGGGGEEIRGGRVHKYAVQSRKNGNRTCPDCTRGWLIPKGERGGWMGVKKQWGTGGHNSGVTKEKRGKERTGGARILIKKTTGGGLLGSGGGKNPAGNKKRETTIHTWWKGRWEGSVEIL